MKTKYVYVTKSVKADMTSCHDSKFKYPKSGLVEAPDWKATNECGKGLHGFLWGEGYGNLAGYISDTKWLLIRVNPTDGLVVMDGKCKFRKGEVIAVGNYKSITKELVKYLPKDRVYKVIGLTRETGDNGVSIVGYRGKAVSGDWGTSTSGWRGTSMSGDSGQSTSGRKGTSTSGNCGQSTSSDSGTSTSGAWGTSITGVRGTAQSGEDGVLIISYWVNGTYYRKVGVIGEAGLKPNTKYKLDDKHKFIEVK